MIPDRVRQKGIRLTQTNRANNGASDRLQHIVTCALASEDLACFDISDMHHLMPDTFEMTDARLPFPTTWFEFLPAGEWMRDIIRAQSIKKIGALMFETDGGTSWGEFKRESLYQGVKWVGDKRIYLIPLALMQDNSLSMITGGWTIDIRKDGHVLGCGSAAFYDIEGEAKEQGVSIDTVFERQDVILQVMLMLPCFVLQLLTCRNVTTEIIHIPKKEREMRKHKGRPPFAKRYELKIHVPFKKVVNESASPGKTPISKAFHTVTGHFANYDEHPLFGKYTGRFWIPAHTRGSTDVGVIQKHYVVEKGKS